jgi:hypothetical protein
MMTKAEYLALAEARFDALTGLQTQPNFYSYEEAFDQIWIDLGRAVLESSIGTVPQDYRKKTSSAHATGKSK